MAVEIERKFLVNGDDWRAAVQRSEHFRQGYLVSDAVRSVRVRVAGTHAWLNLKSATVGRSRREYEYEIPVTDAEEMLDLLCRKPILEKTRHFLEYGGLLWEIDEFEGDNVGLVLAEVELDSAGQEVRLPPWAGQEVTDDVRYYSARLAEHPYRLWGTGGA
ncbi:MAG TPA: CYTH domain-containing protein [Candidatus Competibacteraceae bacterium]|nr:CYTH domain-containing protein [Candidatus Competibacteraceae bacterium]